MINTVVQLQQHNYQVTDTLWHQGEIDYVLGTDEKSYRHNFLSLVDSLRDQQITSPIFVSVASKCIGASNGGFPFHSPDNPIARAQLALPNTQKGIRAGVNTDALLDDLDRYDDCHFSSSGAHKIVNAWAELILGNRLRTEHAGSARLISR